MGETTVSDEPKKVGTVALVGRPNAGKSTLMNLWLAEKVAIVSDKPQTTRQRLVGILTEARGQIVFYDTPGLHKPQHRMNRRMVKAAREALSDADVVCLIHDASQKFGGGDRFLLEWVAEVQTPKLALLNKVDLVRDKTQLLPRIETFVETGGFDEILPISAKAGDGTDTALELIFERLEPGEAFYDPELLTIHPERFLVAERIREKVLEQTRDELPFTTAVVIEAWEEDPEKDLVRIYASILAEKQGQKKILVGTKGQRVKAIGTAARIDLEAFLGQRVYLDLKVRLERDWRENERILSELDRAPFGVG